MKRKYSLFTVITLSLVFSAFKHSERSHYILKNGEIITFMGGPKNQTFLYQATAKRGSYDHSAYAIKLDSLGLVKVSELQEAYGLHQQELDLMFCFGSIQKKSDTLIIDAETKYHTIYFLPLNKNAKLDSLSNKLHLELLAKDEEEKLADILVSGNLRLATLPQNTATKELYKPIHSKKTLAHFSYILIRDDQGKEITVGTDDLLLIAANQLIIEK